MPHVWESIRANAEHAPLHSSGSRDAVACRAMGTVKQTAQARAQRSATIQWIPQREAGLRYDVGGASKLMLVQRCDSDMRGGGDGAMILVTRNEYPESGIETRVHDDTWMRNGKWKSVPAQAMLKSENCQPSFVHEDQLYFILVCRRWNRSPTRYTCDICIHPHECEREKITVRDTLSIHCVKSSCYMRIFY